MAAKRVGILFGVVFFLLASKLSAQNTTASFTVPAQACLSQNIIPVNTSSNAVSYEWDFCQGDLSQTPVATYEGSAGGSTTFATDVVFDGTNWYGFVTSSGTNSIIRLDFGSDYTSVPVKTDLGNISGVLGRPIDIKIIKDSGNWYGFVYSEYTSVTLITRINFGNSLTNTTSSSTPVTAEVVVPGNNVINSGEGFDMVQDGAGWVIVFTQPTSVGIVRLTSVTSFPSASDIILSPALNGSVSSTTLGDIKLIRSNGQWFGYTSDFVNSELYRLSFGATIFSSPGSVNFGGSMVGNQVPYGVDGGFDNGNYFLFLCTRFGGLQRIDLGPDLTQTPVSGTALGNLGLLSTTYKINLFNHLSQWVAFTIDYTNQHIFRVTFPPSSCNTAPSSAQTFQPKLSYTSPGVSYVTLRSFNADGNFDETSAAINVLSGTAPVIDFQSQNSCAQFPVSFTYQSPQTLHAFQWDFGNGDSSIQGSPSETFISAGTYNVNFSAVAPNGCTNQVEKLITIYAAPVADFTLPSPALSCTNQEYVFVNTTAFDTGSGPQWQWNVNGSPVAVSKDLSYAFTTTAAQTVQLVASIPGCFTEKTQSFVIQQQGPVVDFDFSNGCSSKPVAFTNASTGSITGYSWDFGDGTNLSTPSPQKTYASIGTYDVTLTASNPLGCNNSATKQIIIYTTPQTDFSLDLPPFSCSGTSSQFTDATPLMTDSNISSWSWKFGDASNGTSSQQNPSYTYTAAANYTVMLTTGTDRGCSGSVQKQVTISATPIVNFTNLAACLNQPTQFTDASESGTKSWIWTIDGTIHTEQNPLYTFTTTSSHTVQLAATGSNNCIGRITKNITVPLAPSLDFSSANTCSSQSAEFTNQTPATGDPLISYAWDFNGEGTAAGSPVDFTFTSAETANVTMSATAQSGCVYALTRAIVIGKTPQADFISSVDEGEAPLFVQFTNTSADAVSYQWNIDGTTTNAVSPSYTFSALGRYNVALTATGAQGCALTISKVISVVRPGVDLAVDTAVFTYVKGTATLGIAYTLRNDGNTLIINPVVTIGLGGMSSQSQTLMASINPGEAYSQNVIITGLTSDLAYACISAKTSDDIYLYNDEKCITFSSGEFVFDPYPNPVRGLLYIDRIAPAGDASKVTLINAVGLKFYEETVMSSEAGLNQLIVDTTVFSPGVYIVIVTTSAGTKKFRIVVE